MMASVIELTHQHRPDIRVHSYPTPKTSVACIPGGVHIRAYKHLKCNALQPDGLLAGDRHDSRPFRTRCAEGLKKSMTTARDAWLADP